MADWNLGDLASFTLKNFQIRAGNFGAPNSMTDLLFYNPRNGQALVRTSSPDTHTREVGQRVKDLRRRGIKGEMNNKEGRGGLRIC